MKYFVVAIRDSAVKAFMQPGYAPSEEAGVRSFKNLFSQDGPNPLKQNPEDYALFHIGYFDDNTGKLDSIEPNQICRGTDCVPMGVK